MHFWCCLQASALPQAVDNAWSSLGGGPSDLTFPDLFLGTWRVQATLTKVETPLGPEFVPDMKVGAHSATLIKQGLLSSSESIPAMMNVHSKDLQPVTA